MNVKQILNRLQEEHLEDIAAELGLELSDCGEYYLLPGWFVDFQSTCVVHYEELDSATEAAEEYVSGGDWGDSQHVTVDCWRTAIHIDTEEAERLMSEIETVNIHPDIPECADGDTEHEWASDHDVVGGIKENPGVWGNGGGVRITQHCRRCGCGKHIDTWATDPSTGQQGLKTVEYIPGEFEATE